MIDPSKFVYNSNFKYQKIAQKGTTDTSNATLGWVTLTTGVAPGSTWRIGHRFNSDLSSSSGLARLRSNGTLQVYVDRQASGTVIEKWHWRVYAP